MACWMKSFAICRRASRFSRKTRSPISPNGFSPPKSSVHHELPYAVAVFVEKFEDNPRLLRIEAVLNVERDTQKKILIGHKGAMLKKIGTEARKELEGLLDKKVFLGLFVKVAQDWRENPQRVRELDWHFQLEGLSSSAQADQEEGPAEGNVE